MEARAPEDDRLILVDELLMLFTEAAEFHEHHPEPRTVLREAVKVLGGVRSRMRRSARRHVVAVVGLTNVGKSTLLNALLGGELAPRRNGPCTAAPIEFTFGPALRVVVQYEQNLHRPSWECSDVEAIHRCLEGLADESNGKPDRRVRKAIVQVPHRLLADGLVIADTPGFGAALSADGESPHDEMIKQYLARDVTQVFWVVLADQGISKREKSFHDQFFSEICDDVVVTGCEDWDTRDRDRFRRRFTEVFGQRLPRFHFVSGLRGLEARRTGDASGLETAGITLLQKRICEMATPAGRRRAIDESLNQLTEDVGYWLKEYRDERDLPLQKWWRDDSWGRWLLTSPGDDLKRKLTQALQQRTRSRP